MSIRTLLIVFALLICSVPRYAPGGTFIDRVSSTDVRIMSWNVDYDAIFPETNATRAAKFGRVFNAVSPDILCLQEIYSHSQSQVKTLMDSVQPLGTPNGWYVYLNGSNAIVSKYSLSQTRNNTVPAAP